MRRVFHISAKAVKYLLTGIVFLLLALSIFLNSNYFDNLIKNLIQTKLSKAIKRTVTVDAVEFNPFFLDVRLKNFSIGNDPRGDPKIPFFRADEIYARVSWRYVVAGKVRISKVRLTHPELFVEFYPESKGGG